MESPDRIILSPSQFDENVAGVGSSPFVGDMAGTGIAVPPFPTNTQSRRYLFRLVGLKVPSGSTCLIRNIHQLLYIGAKVRAEEGAEDEKWSIEIPVTDPIWHFPDGNVSWHLREVDSYSRNTTFSDDFVFPPGQGSNSMSTDVALLASEPAVGPATYIPLNAGMPYGKSIVSGLGTWRDIRFPWYHAQPNLELAVRGPKQIALYASVYQTDPNRRPNKPVLIETAGLRSEDLFMLNYPDAVYTRIGARMEVDIVENGDDK